MKLTDRIREYIKCPQFGSADYGKWGTLTWEQRKIINELCDKCDIFENSADSFAKQNYILEKENEKLNQQKYNSDLELQQLYSHLGVEAFGEDIQEQAVKEIDRLVEDNKNLLEENDKLKRENYSKSLELGEIYTHLGLGIFKNDVIQEQAVKEIDRLQGKYFRTSKGEYR